MLLLHLDTYKSDNPDRTINSQLLDIAIVYRAEAREIFESYKESIEVIAQIVDYTLEVG